MVIKEGWVALSRFKVIKEGWKQIQGYKRRMGGSRFKVIKESWVADPRL